MVSANREMRPNEKVAPSNPKLSEVLCFAVYSANLAFGKAYKPILEPLGLTYTQFITVVAVSEEDNQTVGSLGEKLFLESNTLTPMLKKLEAMGYLERQRDPADERQVRVSLTKDGRRLRERLQTVSLADATGLGPKEFGEIQKAVVTLRSNLIESQSQADE